MRKNHSRAWHSWETQRRHAEGYLGSQAVLLQPDGVRVDFEVRLGHAAEEIVAVAAEQRATLIAMATHGYSGLKRWTLGSVTDKVIQATPTPVFVVRSAEAAPAGEIALDRILRKLPCVAAKSAATISAASSWSASKAMCESVATWGRSSRRICF